MRPKSMILIVIAMGCGLIASIGISEVIERRTENGNPVRTSQIFVSMVDVPIGTALTAQMVKLEDWSVDKIPDGAIIKIEDIEGRRPRQPLYAGEPILQRKLIDPNMDFAGASGRIPKGFRVVSVKVTMDSAASGLILPGDRVDVLVYLRRGNGVEGPMTKTILTDVTVFAVNQEIDRAVEGETATLQAKTVSLLVQPDQVERLMLAAEMGKLRLSLRRADDDSEVSSSGAGISDLNLTESGQRNSGTGELPVKTTVGSNPLINLLDKFNEPTAPSLSQSVVAYEMEIHSPIGIQRYHWHDMNKLPTELSQENIADFDDSGRSGGDIPADLDSNGTTATDDVIGEGF